jgi:hypothetical protein
MHRLSYPPWVEDDVAVVVDEEEEEEGDGWVLAKILSQR